MLRLDLMHPHVSGNKWFKLKYNIEEAIKNNKRTLLSFGGPYSNHLHALAFEAKENNLKSIGFIRGEKVINDTLKDCMEWGMQLHFISRSEYQQKNELDYLNKLQLQYSDTFIIPEGGNNELGIKGCKEILQNINLDNYHFISTAIATGTTFKGILNSVIHKNKIFGFSSFKNNDILYNDIKNFTENKNWQIISDYHFGGFAKKNNELISFIKEFQKQNNIELDFVYNAKMMFGILDLIKKNNFENGSKILCIHTGGVQGNRSIV